MSHVCIKVWRIDIMKRIPAVDLPDHVQRVAAEYGCMSSRFE
jgi:hypothetical protein